MGIPLRRFDIVVAQNFFHSKQIRPFHHQPRGYSVAKIVKPKILDFGIS